MTDLEKNYNESTFGQKNGQFIVEYSSLWVSDYGCTSESKPQESQTTSNNAGWYEMPVVHVVSQTGFDECTYGGYEIIKSYLSSSGFNCLDFLGKPSYFGLPTQISNLNDLLSCSQKLFEKSKNFEIIIKSESSPPDN
jgi:hypothetical protein